jgi:dihydrofolate synthase/folylpolyglutamate synthase
VLWQQDKTREAEKILRAGLKLNVDEVTAPLLHYNLAEVLRRQEFPITHEAIIRGLETAVHPGRLEYLANHHPPLLLDGAHNLGGAKALADYLSEFATHPLTIIFSALRDKPIAEMARLILPLADSVILTVINDPRSATLEQLSEATSDFIGTEKLSLTRTPAEALKLARQLTPKEGLIAITGSLYLLGQIQQIPAS